MKQLNKKLYKKPSLAAAVFESNSVVSTSGGIVSNSNRFTQITDGSKQNINIDSLK